MVRTQFIPTQLKNEWFDELGRTTLGSSANTISVTFTPKKYLRIVGYVIGSGLVNITMNMNGDTGANYARRMTSNGSADGSTTAASGIALSVGDSNNSYLIDAIITNASTAEKLVIINMLGTPTGAANPPFRLEAFGKWVNTSAQITSLALNQGNTGSFASGTELIILGRD